VAVLDTETLQVVRRVQFPEGSKPWMLRASPDGKEVWVQAATGSNQVLDAQSLETLHVEELGQQPVTVAFSPDGRYNFVTHYADSWVAVMDAQSGKLVKRLEVGQSGANVSFRPDGKFGYVAVAGENTVAVVEMESLEVEKKLRTGEEPMGLIVL
jgi:DNA-binding beta-propeller fold protein YncE